MNKWFFTSESVTEGHPDKICDQISDAVLDEILSRDPQARVACETVVTTGLVMVMGEITTSTYVDIAGVARRTIREIGYTDKSTSFDADTCSVLVTIDDQSTDIARGVDCAYELRSGATSAAICAKQVAEHKVELGAGDQGLMFGYANDDTPELMPLPITLAHKLAKQLADVRKAGKAKTFLPDGKTQVTVEYHNQEPVHIDTVVISTQHDGTSTTEQVESEVYELVLKPIMPSALFDKNTKVLINPTGRFVVGGPVGDSGLTGRKIIVDTYGGFSRHGGGAFSGKDPTKVDRSSAYAARYLAKNIVAAGLARQCEVQLAYAIGVAEPVSLYVDTFNTGVYDDDLLAKMIRDTIALDPQSIIDRFDLRRPLYRQVACYGHFGRSDLNLPWEKTDSVELFKQYFQQ